MIKAESLVMKNPEEARKIISKKLGVSEDEVATIMSGSSFKVSLDQSLLTTLEDQARWAVKNKLTETTKIPNYLNFIYPAALEAIKPEAVTIIR